MKKLGEILEQKQSKSFDMKYFISNDLYYWLTVYGRITKREIGYHTYSMLIDEWHTVNWYEDKYATYYVKKYNNKEFTKDEYTDIQTLFYAKVNNRVQYNKTNGVKYTIEVNKVPFEISRKKVSFKISTK